MLGLFTTVRVQGIVALADIGPRIYVFNHLSMLDLFLITLAIPPSIVSLARHWPFAVPFFGPVMRLGRYIDVEQVQGEALLERARTMLAQGISLAIFPEGSRSRTGQTGRLRSGAFKLSIATGVPVAPVWIEGSGQVLAPGSWLLGHGEICVRILAQVPPEPFMHDQLGHTALRRKVRKAMENARSSACIAGACHEQA